MQKLIVALALVAAAPVRRGVPRNGRAARAARGPLWCPISVDPWVPGAPFYSKWESEFDGTAEPVVDLGVGITTDGLFNVGDDNGDCGVKGHAVIVHKGGTGTGLDAPGTRVGCCVLA